ncbi:MAG TPA: MbnP family copper-binding protein [Candidatus Binatia bacterium]|jgi:uncharacterized repeat protein (TIGR04052 family)|nr:MbnP family copper-binding protein [Candidatus Binatia bacterium]
MLKKFFVLALMSGALLGAAVSDLSAQPAPTVSLRFSATVNGAPFECGKSYSNIGTTRSTITPTDFRLYVSNVELLTESGRAVPVKLSQDGTWQYQNVALLDFEDGSGPCRNGTQAIRTHVSGTVPDGKYSGVRFVMGVPFELNHGDPTLAPSPLNITAMFWNWQGGYKFLKVDMTTSGLASPAHIHKTGAGHGRHGSHGADESSGFSVHLGSTVCAARSPTESPTGCKNPNRVTVTFEKFDPERNVIVADLGALLANTNVDHNTPDTSPGCMSFPKDPDCTAVMSALGLAYDGAPAAGRQKFFSVK